MISSLFNRAINFCIGLSGLLVVIDSVEQLNCDNPGGKARSSLYLDILEAVFSIIFLLEMGLKMLAVGITGYWKTAWWRFDGVITLASALAFLTLFVRSQGSSDHFSVVADCSGSIYSNTTGTANGASSSILAQLGRAIILTRILRIIRIFRFLRILSGIRSLRSIVSTSSGFIGTFPKYLWTYAIIIHVYAVAGMWIWQGLLSFDASHGEELRRTSFAGSSFVYPNQPGGVLDRQIQGISGLNGTTTVLSPYMFTVNFNSYGSSLRLLFSVSMLNNWHIIHDACLAALGLESRAVTSAAQIGVSLYFLSYIVLMVCVFLNIVQSHFLNSYERHASIVRRESVEREEQNEVLKSLEEIDATLLKEEEATRCCSFSWFQLNCMKPTVMQCAIDKKLRPASECCYALIPDLLDVDGVMHGYEPVVVAKCNVLGVDPEIKAVVTKRSLSMTSIMGESSLLDGSKVVEMQEKIDDEAEKVMLKRSESRPVLRDQKTA